MTRETLRAADPALAKALDSFDPPPLPADFTGRVVAAAGAKSAPPLPRTRPAARRRPGPWGRGRTALMGAAIVVAGTTAAAATGLLERAGVDMQPVNAIVERVAEAVTGREPAAAVPPERVEAQPAQAAAGPNEPGELDDPRRERLARAIALRMERRIAAADARGIAVPERFRDTAHRLSPERAEADPERAALVERVQQIREQLKESASEQAGETAAGEPALAEADLARIAAEWAELSWRERIALVRPLDRTERRRLFAMLTPEQRAELVAMRRSRSSSESSAQNF